MKNTIITCFHNNTSGSAPIFIQGLSTPPPYTHTTHGDSLTIKLFLLGAILSLLTACGGGGSTPDSAPPLLIPFPRTTVDPKPFPTLPTPSAEQVAVMTYESFPAYASADNHLSLIKAATAYARGATGMGETVVIVDSGIDASHQEFQGGKVMIVTGIGNSCSPSSANMGQCADSAHGTAVAAVAAGHRGSSSSGSDMHGVAFDAQIKFIPISLRGSSPSSPPRLGLNDYTWVPTYRDSFDDSADDYRQYIAQGKILNYSFGSNWALSEWKTLGANCGNIDETGPYACYKYYYRPIVDALTQAGTLPADKSIIVIAAGNARGARHDLLTNRDSLGALIDATSPAADASLAVVFNGADDPNLDHVITVVAVGADGIIASYSNLCGKAKAFCIAAPGGDSDDDGILSAQAGGNYNRWRGTSFAAPQVSGSLALLRQYFRGQLGNTELVNRLLATANREGIYDDSDTYGHGLVDLDTATAPVGPIMTGLPSDLNSRSFAGSGIALSGGVFGASLQSGLADIEVAGFDALGAPFFQSAANWVTRPAQEQSGIDRKTQALSLTSPYNNARQNNDISLSLSIENDGAIVGIAGIRLAFADGWWVSYGQHGGQLLGLYEQSFGGAANRRGIDGVLNSFDNPLAFATPYLSLVGDGAGFGWSHSVSNSNKHFGFVLLHGAAGFDRATPKGGNGVGILLNMTINHDPGGAGLALQAGVVRETDRFLGAQPQGAFGKASAATAFVGINGAWAFGKHDRWHLLTSAYLGHTRPQIDSSGLLRDASPIVSSAFSIGAGRNSLWRTDDWFGLRLSQPLRAESGNAQLRLPVGRTKYGEVLHQNYAVSLVPADRAIHAEVMYRLPIASGALTTSMAVEQHPQHSTRNLNSSLWLSFERRF